MGRRNDTNTTREHCDKLGLGDKSDVTTEDVIKLIQSLEDAGELELASYIGSLKSPAELQDLLVNTIYEE